MGARILQIAKHANSDREGIRRGCLAFLEHSQNPAYQRIVLTEAPTVLGVEVWSKMDAKYTTQSLVEALTDLTIDGGNQVRNPEAFAEALSGAMNQLSRWVFAGNSLVEANEALEELMAIVI
jgi:hypothetical protein